MVYAGSAWIWNCGAFCQARTQFTAKGATILELRRFTRRRSAARPSKCGGFGGRKAAPCFQVPPCFKVSPCFKVPPQRICCLLFDVRTNRISYDHRFSPTTSVCPIYSDNNTQCANITGPLKSESQVK